MVEVGQNLEKERDTLRSAGPCTEQFAIGSALSAPNPGRESSVEELEDDKSAEAVHRMQENDPTDANIEDCWYAILVRAETVCSCDEESTNCESQSNQSKG